MLSISTFSSTPVPYPDTITSSPNNQLLMTVDAMATLTDPMCTLTEQPYSFYTTTSPPPAMTTKIRFENLTIVEFLLFFILTLKLLYSN